MKRIKMTVYGLIALCVLTGCSGNGAKIEDVDVDVPVYTESNISVSGTNQETIYTSVSSGNNEGNESVSSGNENVDGDVEYTSVSSGFGDISISGSDQSVKIVGGDDVDVSGDYVNGDVDVTSGYAGDNNSTDNSVHAENINVYVDKVMTELTDINGRTVQPFADNGEVYVPLTSLGGILGEAVEYDRQTKAVYVGESPNRSTNMLDFIHGYDSQFITEYSYLENKGNEHFTMAGKNYTDGMTANNTYGTYNDASVNFNLEGKYEKLSFTFGHLDGTYMNPTKLIIKLDGYVEKEVEINAEDYPVSIELDVTNAMQLRFEMEMPYHTGYAFTNMVLT